jgi:hypothetical protein
MKLLDERPAHRGRSGEDTAVDTGLIRPHGDSARATTRPARIPDSAEVMQTRHRWVEAEDLYGG